MIKILCFSRESSLFVLFQSIVRSISLIEAKQLYSRRVIIFNHCRSLHPINVLMKNKKIKNNNKKEKCYVHLYTLFSITELNFVSWHCSV